MKFVDLNSDVGEAAGHDAALMPLITSANISCGAHAGSPAEARQTLTLAQKQGVVAGAHPGHPDPANFGRLELPLDPDRVFENCVYQIGALAGLTAISQIFLKYIKPHGGLYHQANREEQYADAVIAAACQFNLMVMGLPGSRLEDRCRGRCEYVAEGFADRRYRPDGTLVPRDQPDAFVEDPEEAVAQVERLLNTTSIRTICVHGDNVHAISFVQALRTSLQAKGFTLRAFA